MNCKRIGDYVFELDCHICGFCEREAVKEAARSTTLMDVECPYCRRIWDQIDGQGVAGTTSRICDDPACQDEFKRIFHAAKQSKDGLYQ